MKLLYVFKERAFVIAICNSLVLRDAGDIFKRPTAKVEPDGQGTAQDVVAFTSQRWEVQNEDVQGGSRALGVQVRVGEQRVHLVACLPS
jgi:hypothetical protein